ncbi:unnamed protein product [Caenorhabditis angaria]|uniref:Acyltransferase 3 domain-containing protein n=1 Tax=Caenorhabditis angaria TaxID=860376 RepID=A0A9P1MV76_9PELO|nr:unnamed protein product [Caenorhabditis angaria]
MFGSKCDSTWSILSHFVFASNFLPTQCVPWLWHVALDFQLYLIFPLLVLLLIKFPKFGWLPILGLIAICLIYRTLAFTVFDLPINIFTKMLSAQKFDRVIENTYRFVYTAPFSRAPPFFIGILTGWCFLAQPTALTISATKSAALQCLALTLLSASLFVSGNIPHAVLYRCAWSCGVAILITLAPGWLVFVLGSQRYVVLARLSFGVFLAHEPILLYRLNTLHQPISDFTLTNIIFQSLAIYVVSLGLAWILAMVIEIPLITLERRVFMGPQKLAVRQRRVSFSENGDTIFGDDEEEMVEEERVQTTRDEILGESEMKFDEKAKNWLKTCGILEADSKC